MPIPDEIAKTISLIDGKVMELNRAKAALLDAFGGNGNGQPAAFRPAQRPQTVPPPPTGETEEPRVTRKNQLRSFLIHNGPSTRAQVVAGLGPEFPEGTLAFLLNDKQGFRRNQQGLWEVSE